MTDRNPALANQGFYRRYLKRPLDIAAAALLSFALAPVAAVVAAIVAVSMGRPVLFTQRRAGLHGGTFDLYKFRTMTDARNASGRLLEDHERLTFAGRLLRRTSLDELPQLANVLRGDMSLIGPRPLLPEYLDRYTPVQARRHLVRPGITGWAQVNGRQDIPFSRRLELDVQYVEEGTWLTDVKIALMTLARVFRTDGVRCGQRISDVDDLGLHPESRPTESRSTSPHIVDVSRSQPQPFHDDSARLRRTA